MTGQALGKGEGACVTTAPVVSRPLHMWRQPSVYLPALLFVVFLAGWEAYGRASNPLLFAPPSTVANAMARQIASGEFQSLLLITLSMLGVGFGSAVLSGILTGVILGRYQKLADVLDHYIEGVYATPLVVITPLVRLWFGVTFVGAVVIVWLAAVVPMILSIATGVRHARRDLIEVARSCLASERDLIRHVILPGLVPYLAAGLRISAGRAVIGVVVAEMFLTSTGVGGMMRESTTLLRIPDVLVGAVTYAALGGTLIGAMRMLERRVSEWKEQ
jgi:ABC-type nitrate/sulfonate/bicarbonate transport system permease component